MKNPPVGRALVFKVAYGVFGMPGGYVRMVFGKLPDSRLVVYGSVLGLVDALSDSYAVGRPGLDG
jgi:hypothetical protein